MAFEIQKVHSMEKLMDIHWGCHLALEKEGMKAVLMDVTKKKELERVHL
jgi:hypothetical protein